MHKLVCVAVLVAVSGCSPSGLDLDNDKAEMRGDGSVESDAGKEDAGIEDAGAVDVPNVEMDAGMRACFLDRDGDGVGAGVEVPCDFVVPVPDAGAVDGGPDGGRSDDAGVDVVIPSIVDAGGDCDDADARRAPGRVEECDGIDNDCDEVVDEAAKNACGGQCVRPLLNEPGEACTNGMAGACSREGEFICDGDQQVRCSASAPQPSSELCGDAVDNDCDGLVDEPDAIDAPTWYQDCDADGFAGSTDGSVKGCTKPANAGSCTWTNVVPNQSSRSNWDCDDSSAAYSPNVTRFGFPPAGKTSFDLNCNGVAEPAVDDQQEAPRVCAASVIACLNSGDNRCQVTRAAAVNDCAAWTLANGTTVAAPARKCPDTGGRLGWFADFDGDGMFSVSAYSDVGPIWRCR